MDGALSMSRQPAAMPSAYSPRTATLVASGEMAAASASVSTAGLAVLKTRGRFGDQKTVHYRCERAQVEQGIGSSKQIQTIPHLPLCLPTAPTPD